MKSVGEERAALKGDVLRGGPEIVEILSEDWRKLCEEPGNDLPFSRPEWVDAYFRNNTGTWVVFALRRGKRLVAVLPLIEKRRRISHLPVTVLRMPSDFHLWPFDLPVAQDVDKQSAARVLWKTLKEYRGWDMLEFPNIPQRGFTEYLFNAAVSDGFPNHRWEYMYSPFIKLNRIVTDKDPLAFAKSRNLRANIRKATRRLRQKGRVRISISKLAKNDVLSRMYELENASWKGRVGTSIAAKQKDIDFWNRVAHAGAQFGYLSLCSITLGNAVVAALIGFSYKKNYFAIKMGWDESLRSFSLGHMLVVGILNECLDTGLKHLFLGGLRSAWKEQWTDSFLPHASHYIFCNTLYGRIMRRVKLREIKQMEVSFPQKSGFIENVKTKAAASLPSGITSPRIFFAPTLPGLKLQHLFLKRGALNHFPFNNSSAEYFYNARSAIYTLAEVFKLHGEEVLFPSYCCGVDLEALLTAGVSLKLYPVHEDMRIDVSEIISRMTPSTKAVYVIHYLGFPSPVKELSAFCRERGLRLIEDCALALFSRLGDQFLGSFGDAAVFSLYKSLPVPSGGVLVFNDSVQREFHRRYPPPLRSTLAHLRLSLQRNLEMNCSVWGQKALEAARTVVRKLRPSMAETPVVEIMTDKFDTEVCRFKMSKFSHWIVRSVNPKHIVERRRANFKALHKALGGSVQPVFDNLPEGVCPLFYAIKVDDNKETMRVLREKGIEAWAWWWPTHPRLTEAPCAEAQKLRRQVVVIPCHEGIPLEGVARISDAVCKALRNR